MSMKTVDNTVEPDEDSYETDPELIKRMQTSYDLKFGLDVAAKDYNSKCNNYLDDAMHKEWIIAIGKRDDVWCNPPHSMNLKFIKRADAQHKKWNINICMIIPTNVQSSAVWHELIETETHCIVENHPIKRRPKFFKHGRKTKHSSRNAYRVIIWRSK